MSLENRRGRGCLDLIPGAAWAIGLVRSLGGGPETVVVASSEPVVMQTPVQETPAQERVTGPSARELREQRRAKKAARRAAAQAEMQEKLSRKRRGKSPSPTTNQEISEVDQVTGVNNSTQTEGIKLPKLRGHKSGDALEVLREHGFVDQGRKGRGGVTIVSNGDVDVPLPDTTGNYRLTAADEAKIRRKLKGR